MKIWLLRRTALVLAVVLLSCIVFAGCGEEEDLSVESQASETSTETENTAVSVESAESFASENTSDSSAQESNESSAEESALESSAETSSQTTSEQSSAPEISNESNVEESSEEPVEHSDEPIEESKEPIVEIKKPSDEEIAKLVKEVEKYHPLFSKEFPNAKALDLRRVLEMYAVTHNIRDAAPETILQEGWVFFEKREVWSDFFMDVYRKYVPRKDVDDWTKAYFGCIYDYTGFEVTTPYYSDRAITIVIIYDEKTDSIVYERYVDGLGGGPEDWSDFIRYGESHGKVDDYTYGFTFYLHTSTMPKNGKPEGDYTVYRYYYPGWDGWECYPNPFQNYQNFGATKEQPTPIWKVPYTLLFRYDGEYFKFVSFGKA